jgi:hypothetical protein
MRTLIILIITGLLAATLAGCLTPDAAQDLDAASAPADGSGPHAVLAFIDTGINPYHVAFRDDSARAFQHPGEYLPDYPVDAVKLNLTFDHETLEDAVQADCAEWEKVEPDTVYWVPGTRVVGAIFIPGDAGSTQPGSSFECGTDDHFPPFIQGGGHGTMVASRGAGNDYGACEACLIVAVQGFNAQSVTWTADQPWIDLQSNSWGPITPLFDPTGVAGLVAADAAFVEAVEAAAQAQPSFWASGNGAGFRYGVLGHPTQAVPHMGPSAIRVGGHDSGQVAFWPGSSPHVISDACWSWAAENNSMDESTPRTGGGTSGATPFVAGLAGRVILEARTILEDDRTGVHDGVLARGAEGIVPSGPLADGQFTMDELKRVLYATADPRPERIDEDGDVCEPTEEPLYALYWGTPVAWRDVPEGAHGIPFVGYGAVTPYTVDVVDAILRGDAEVPERPDEDAFFDADDDYRETMYDVYTLSGGLI